MLLSTAVSWSFSPGRSDAAAATAIKLQLSVSSIVADGVSKSTATATVTDASAAPVLGETVTFDAPGDEVSATKEHPDGTYTATITSTKSGQSTITASDGPLTSAGKTLTRTPGPAADIALVLSKSSIVANGVDASPATATVTDAHNNPVPGATVTFSAPGDTATPVTCTTAANGMCSSAITSTTAGQSSVTASDGASTSAGTTLARTPVQQDLASTTTSLVPAASHLVTNQSVILVATVTSSQAGTQPAGTITFENRGSAITGCANESVATTNQSATIFCQTSFAASTAQLTAVFTPGPTASVTGSTSPVSNLTIGKDSSSTFLTVPNPVTTGAKTTFFTTVVPGDAGSVEPSGSVQFLDNGQPVAGCPGQLLKREGSSSAACTVSYSKIASHSITVRYGGDANFNGSSSSAQAVQFRTHSTRILGTITATMEWTFVHTPAYTKVLALYINGVRVGATITVKCRGQGCPVGKTATVVTKPKPCKRKGKHRCPKPPALGTMNLAPRFHSHRLHPGAKITIEITQPGWIGKYYTFTARARRAPSIRIGASRWAPVRA